jgi:hypothetical protein
MAGTGMKYELVPITKDAARRFIQEHHRHNEAPIPAQVSIAVGLELDGVLVAVATAGYPVARALNDGRTLEVNRVCVEDDHKNANTAMYGAIRRAAKALGFRRLVTYTLVSESGASLRAAGFAGPVAIGRNTWVRPNQRDRVRYDVTLWGERRNAANLEKYRWEMAL